MGYETSTSGDRGDAAGASGRAPHRRRPGPSADGLLGEHLLAVGASTVIIAAVVLGALAFGQLDDGGRSDFYGDVAKLSYQAIVVVVLGALVKQVLDDVQDRRSRREHEQLQRAGYIRRVVDVSHTVELGRTFMWANRSVKTWDAQMAKLINAYVDLRDIRHDVATVRASGAIVFEHWDGIVTHVRGMEQYLESLIDEYSKNKKPLSELQLEAEAHRHRQNEVWTRLIELPELGAFLASGYGAFRAQYEAALLGMRGVEKGSAAAMSA